MCECYQVGGPWIDYDPDCPVHGNDARRYREDAEQERQSLEDRIESLEQQVARLEQTVQQLIMGGPAL